MESAVSGGSECWEGGCMVEGFTVWSGLMSAVRGKEGALDLDRPLSRQRGADQFSGKGPLKKKLGETRDLTRQHDGPYFRYKSGVDEQRQQ